ncbi:hypothetical protein F3H64_22705 [Enterobacter hormaechei]|nr:hypothetical protein DN066_00860 [Enterobacter hormaechei subsp. xiangfangensis]KAA0878974.1 hypothetical protein EYC94_19545 [Enterobacter hormaechei]MBE8859524.1 hypothetical protein [Enterobacter hormaechei]MPV42178.1 hypothetical protein [Enterobacter hormaechei]MPV74792.1 hypothetical protein [Enterobacter hormaechei]
MQTKTFRICDRVWKFLVNQAVWPGENSGCQST